METIFKSRPLFFLLIFTCFSGCTTNEDVPKEKKEENIKVTDEESELEDCDLHRRNEFVAEFTDIKGMVVGPDPKVCSKAYTLTAPPEVPNPDRFYLNFYACNLPEAFKADSLKVIYSGYLYTTPDTFDICAHFFKLTEIHLQDTTNTKKQP